MAGADGGVTTSGVPVVTVEVSSVGVIAPGVGSSVSVVGAAGVSEPGVGVAGGSAGDGVPAVTVATVATGVTGVSSANAVVTPRRLDVTRTPVATPARIRFFVSFRKNLDIH